MANQPHLLVESGDCPPVALLPGDPGRVDRIADRCAEREVLAENREYRVVRAVHEGTPLTVCSTGIGSPSAAIAVEELAAVGVETFLRVGTCGALQAGIDVGDMVVATAAAKDEGTTGRYEADTVPAAAGYEVLAALTDAAERREADGGGSVRVGPVATDDAFYAETESYVEAWEAAGLLAVEMEAAAVFSLARRKGASAGAICTVDGNLVEGTQKGETDDAELPPAAADNVGRAIDIALDAATTLAGR